MKVPRGVAGDRLIAVLQHGYEILRQKGSHVRLRHHGPPEHVVTVPKHKAIKVGTLHAILTEVARMRSRDVTSLIQML